MPKTPRGRDVFGDKIVIPKRTPDPITPIFDGRMPPTPTPEPLVGPLFQAQARGGRPNRGAGVGLPTDSVNSVAPSIDNTTPVVGDTLTGSEGTWSPTPTSYTYQWYADGVAIGGATAITFVVTDTQYGTVLTFGVTPVDPSGDEAVSAATSAVDFDYLLRDEFTTAEVAPIASPRTAEPGPGALTVVQTDGQFSISSAKLNIPAQASPAQSDLGFIATVGLARAAGRALYAEFTKTNATTFYPALALFPTSSLGIFSSAQSALAFYSAGRLEIVDATSTLILDETYAGASSYVFALVLRTTGAFIFFRSSGTWRLVWVGTVGTTTPLYPAMSNYDGVATSEFFRIRDLPAPFATDNGIASVNVTNPTSGAAQTATADALTDITFALNGSPSADEVAVRLNYRVQDANNKWTAYIKRNAGNTAWDYLVDSVSAGTPTNRKTVTGVGSPTTLRAIYEGSLHDGYSFQTATWSQRGSRLNISHMNTETAINVEFAAGTTVSALKSFPRTSAAYAELSRGIS